jgi:hypothetical protein
MAANDRDDVAEAIFGTLMSPNEADRNLEAANVVDGLYEISRALHHIARAIESLGNNNAATDMGAIEAATVTLTEALGSAASTIAEAMAENQS